MRKLASIVQIATSEPIPDSDKLSVVTMEGKAWRIVTGRDEFHPGDIAVYFEIDSALPVDDERYSFLHERCLRTWRDKKGKEIWKQAVRIRTIKLRGVISQGLVMPIASFPELANKAIGEDATDILRVEHYDEICAKMQERLDANKRANPGRQAGNFPSFIPKTDEERIQNLADWPGKLKGVLWEVTEKKDGCLSGETFIDTDHGKLKINRIVCNKLDVQVLTYNEEAHRCEHKPIAAYHKYKLSKPMVRVWIARRSDCTINSKTKGVKCTADHKVYTDKGWIEAGQLTRGTVIYRYEQDVSPVVKEMLLGCLLGDSSIAYRHSSDGSADTYANSVWFGHAEAQDEYLMQKARLLGNLWIDAGYYTSGYGSRVHRGHTVSVPSVNSLINSICMVYGKKRLTEDWLRSVTPLSLAFWYLDDGSLMGGREHTEQDYFAVLNTQRWSDSEIDMLTGMLARFGIVATKALCSNTGRWRLRIGTETAMQFFSLIAPYVCDCMKYKLPADFRQIPCVLDFYPNKSTDAILPSTVLAVEAYVPDSKHQTVYDLEIVDNHNYFANGMLVHNSSETIFWAPETRPDNPIGVCSRNFELKPDDENSAWWEIANSDNLKLKVRRLGEYLNKDIAVQGELIGPGMNGNRDNLKEREFRVFRIWNITDQCYIPSRDRQELCRMFGIPHVPVLNPAMDVFTELPTVDDVLAFAEGLTDNGNEREGLVFKEANVTNPRSFKAVSNRYLLKLK